NLGRTSSLRGTLHVPPAEDLLKRSTGRNEPGPLGQLIDIRSMLARLENALPSFRQRSHVLIVSGARKSTCRACRGCGGSNRCSAAISPTNFNGSSIIHAAKSLGAPHAP